MEDQKRDSRPGVKSTLMQQISQTQHTLEQGRYRVEVLERSLKYREMSIEEREQLEKELQEIKKILAENETVLKLLQGENRKTANVAGLVFCLCFFIYCIYTLLTNTN